jgi:hypothetical protein
MPDDYFMICILRGMKKRRREEEKKRRREEEKKRRREEGRRSLEQANGRGRLTPFFSTKGQPSRAGV